LRCAGDVVNEVRLEYNARGRVTVEYQAHGGAVDTSSTPKVGYGYSDGSGGHVRPTTMTYPDGRVLHYGYDAGADERLNRISFLADSAGSSVGQHLAEYRYLGVGSFVRVDYPEASLRGDLAHGSGSDPYAGLDRFGRVIDLRWRNTAADQDVERVRHGYDLAGNRLWRECPVATAAGHPGDELYTYDSLNRLVAARRGQLNAAQDGILPATQSFAETWSLDATGNWRRYQRTAAGGGGELDQTRTHNRANEIAGLDATVGSVWAQPQHDRAGNMTRLPQPADPTRAFACVYDAWNRLVKVVDAATEEVVAKYHYDGRNFRVVNERYAAGQLAETRHGYYNGAWQLLEERVGGSTAAAAQYIWGVRYIDELVLRDRDTNDDGALDERLYALQDANWNVTALADASGAVVERYRYTPYGTPTVYDPGWTADRPTSLFHNTVLYTGRELDPETGFYHYRMRSYDSGLGRFLSKDPISYFSRDTNLYRYCWNNATNYVDPLGLAVSGMQFHGLSERYDTEEQALKAAEEYISSHDVRQVDVWSATIGLFWRNEVWWVVAADKEPASATQGSRRGFVGAVGLVNVKPAVTPAQAVASVATAAGGLVIDLVLSVPTKYPTASQAPQGAPADTVDEEAGRHKWRCTAKPRGCCPEGCDRPFPGYGDTYRAAYDAAFAACTNAGCHTPGEKPHSCNCGHITCRKSPN